MSDPITREAIDYFSKLHPDSAIRIRPFLGGYESEAGLVPPDWNGKVVDVGYPWERLGVR